MLCQVVCLGFCQLLCLHVAALLMLTASLLPQCRSGKVIHELASLPLAEDIPIAFNSCRQGPRSVGWRSDKPAELVWTEAQVCTLSCPD